MQYMGGKTRQGKYIEEQLLKYKGSCVQYVEPFMGGGSMFARMAPHFPGAALGADVHPDLMMMMWEALQDGWEPPTEVAREDWYRIKGEGPSALRGFVGFGCSFGGRWFEGYASNGRGDDFCKAARTGVLRKSAAMREARFLTAPYTALDPGEGTLVYCDPPYADSKPYSGTEKFDTDAFWATVRRWADNGATTLVSEYTAPEWAEEVWSRDATVTLKSDDNGAKAVERLFLVRPQVSDPTPTVEDDRDDDPAAQELSAILPLEGDDVSDKGPWFGAMYDGRCSVNECAIFEGDRICADGQGGYECEDCGGFEVEKMISTQPAGVDPEVSDWQQASLGVDGDNTPVAAMYSEPTEEAVTDALPGTDWQQQASEAARRHVAQDAMAFLDEANHGLRPEYRVTADEFLDPAATEDVKPVIGVSGQPKRVRRDHMDRYAVVLPGETELETFKTSGKPVGRTRVTTFVKQASSTIKLGEWKARNVVIGASRRRDLLLKAQGLTHEDDRDRLNAIARELEEAAGAKVGSDLGTYLHDFTEYMDAGLKTWMAAPQEFRKSLKGYAQALQDAGLEPIPSLIERTTIIQEFGWVCGTFDRVFYHRPSGQYVIGDLKTAKTMDYGKNEIEAQLWAYAHGVNQNGIYDWNTDCWMRGYPGGPMGGRRELPRVSEAVGVVIHMPVQGKLEGTVQLLWADLEAGARHAQLCQDVRSQPKGKMQPWGDGPAPLTPPSWEERFRGVESNAQASGLWLEAKAEGIQGQRLEALIDLARQSIRLHSLGMDVRG